MEEIQTSPFAKSKQKLTNKLFLSNKVGIAKSASNSREKDATNVAVTSKNLNNTFQRPLSLSINNNLQITSELRRRSSTSESNLFEDSRKQHTQPQNLFYERSFSHDTLIHQNSECSSSSTDSLARKALIAAHVLHLIPTKQARQRNYLQGRIGANSLLGVTQLECTFPNREVTIFVGTWNMNGQNPPGELNDFVLPTGLEHVPDILVFGTQESCSEKFEWEVNLQETLGPSHVLFHSTSLDVTQNFDYIFWSGDLNFRLATPRNEVLQWLSNTNFPLPSHLPHGYMHHDQLCSVLADGAAFKGFHEANITFPPTYKYDTGTQNFDTSSKQRTPAYTDRILYKSRTARRLSGQSEIPPLQCIIYDSVQSITTSDHKPVWGVFKAHIRPGIDTIPLAAGLFNREVYLEGLHRRVTLSEYRNGSTVCSIQ